MNINNFKSNILEIFPTPVYLGNVPSKFKSLIKFFDSQKMTNNKDADSKDWGNRSLDTYILNKPECLEFSSYVLNLAYLFGQQFGYQYEKYRFTQSWISWKHPQHQHSPHFHSNSVFSGVFYYGEYDDNYNLQFLKPMNNTGLNLEPNQKLSPNSKYSYPTVNLNTKPGNIVIFPSNLNHSVPENKSKNIRKSLAFNILPIGALGEYNRLTELKM